jgi:hypothetical protein
MGDLTFPIDCAKANQLSGDFWQKAGQSTGDTCAFDTDCDSGKRCQKAAGNVYGVCE